MEMFWFWIGQISYGHLRDKLAVSSAVEGMEYEAPSNVVTSPV